MRAVMAYLQGLRGSLGRDGVVATFERLAKRAGSFLWGNDEVLFFEWSGAVTPDAGAAKLEPLDLNHLASAASQDFDDPSTLAYLLRSASRLRNENAEGFGFVDSAETFLHFAWVTDFDGFYLSELNAKVDAPSADCVMLFDCWTPGAARGHGYYGQAISLIAGRMREKGKKPWIFSAASNVASIRGLEKAGFQRRYSLIRRRVLGWQRIRSKVQMLQKAPASAVSARL